MRRTPGENHRRLQLIVALTPSVHLHKTDSDTDMTNRQPSLCHVVVVYIIDATRCPSLGAAHGTRLKTTTTCRNTLLWSVWENVTVLFAGVSCWLLPWTCHSSNSYFIRTVTSLRPGCTARSYISRIVNCEDRR